MAKAVQRRRGTTAQHASFTGLAGEITVDTDKKVAVVHDGSTAGGIPLAKAATTLAGYGITDGQTLPSYTTTATAAGTTTLTSSSTRNQYFTGTSAQTVVLPVTSTLATGFSFRIVNLSTGLLTIQSSGANTITVLPPGTEIEFVCILTSGTTAASWSALARFASLPQRSYSAARTFDVTDVNCHIFHPDADTSARTWTIDSNANLALPIGSFFTFINGHGAGVLTIAITSDTMRLSSAGTTGSRTLAANGMATAVKVTATEWKISGTGLT